MKSSSVQEFEESKGQRFKDLRLRWVILIIAVFIIPAAALSPDWIARWLFLQTEAAFPKRVADGQNSDWTMLTQKPYIGNTAILATNGTETEWVWRDKLYDQRQGTGWVENMNNWDIEQVRIIADTSNLYFYVEFDQFSAGWADWVVQFNIAIDTEIAINPNGGTNGMNWFGDESQTDLARPEQYSEINISCDGVQSPGANGVWVFRQGAASWYQAVNSTVAFSNPLTDGYMEIAIRWSDIGFSSIPPRLRMTMASAKRNCDNPEPAGQDKTADLYNSDMIDAVSYGVSNTTEEWFDELQDGNVFCYVDIAFDANGNCINPKLPEAPGNLRVYDPTDNKLLASGDTCYTNNPLLIWDPVSPDGDSGDSILGYYVQISTSAVVNADGFFHQDFGVIVAKNTNGTGQDNRVVYTNNYIPQAWLGSSDSSTGIPNGISDGNPIGTPILIPGQTYYIRVWARDRRGMLGAPSATYVLPIDYPVWHDPYTFLSLPGSPQDGWTFRATREPKTNSDVDFILGVYDPPPKDPKDIFYIEPTTGTRAPNEILNVVLHIRRAVPGSATWDWATQAANIPLGNDSQTTSGTIAWFRPNVWNAFYSDNDPDSYSYWKTGGNIDIAKTLTYKCTKINLGNTGDGLTFKLNATAGDTIEYYFELNDPNELPGSNYNYSKQPRRFIYAYDNNGITGYRIGTLNEARTHPFRFVVQTRDLPAVWHNPLSNEAILSAGGETYTMRSPVWPDTAQNVRMFIGTVSANTLNWQIVYRTIGSAGWNTQDFVGAPVLADASKKIYYYNCTFNYTGGMIEYYFKTTDVVNPLYIFQNGITDNANTVYVNSISSEGEEAKPFRFPFLSRIKVTSTASIGKDSYSIVSILGFRSPQFDALNDNAIGVNKVLSLSSDTIVIEGNIFSNVFPGSHYGLRDTPGSPEPRKLFGRSYAAILAGVTINVVNGIRKAFFGPIFPFDYIASDTTKWNTGSDAYENVPILTYADAFANAVERKEPPETIFSAVKPLEGVIYVEGNASISTINITKGALICSGTITIPTGAIVNASRLDLCSIGGDITIAGKLEVDTGVLFSNKNVIINSGATVKLKKLGSIVAQNLEVGQGVDMEIRHPQASSYAGTKESVISRATRWVISALRETKL